MANLSNNNDINVCLIPAAGFGKRVGAPPAKEMLKDPKSDRPLIDWSLELALEMKLKPVVISRKEKSSLNLYVESNWSGRGVELLLIESSREWPDTILKSRAAWGEINLLLLPDTRFGPRACVQSLIFDCESGRDTSFGIFRTDEKLETWGVLDWSKQLSICEKPSEVLSREKLAPWGLIAFQKKCGEKLFSELLTSNQNHKWSEIDFSFSVHELEFFKDITRSSTDLEY